MDKFIILHTARENALFKDIFLKKNEKILYKMKGSVIFALSCIFCIVYGFYLVLVFVSSCSKEGTVSGTSFSLIETDNFVYQHVRVESQKPGLATYLFSQSPNVIQGNRTLEKLSTIINNDPCNCDNCHCWNDREANTYVEKQFFLLPNSTISATIDATANVKYYLFSQNSFWRWTYRHREDELDIRQNGEGVNGTINYTVQKEFDQALSLVIVSATNCGQIVVNLSILTIPLVYDINRNVKQTCQDVQCTFVLSGSDRVVASIGATYKVTARETFLLHFTLDPLISCIVFALVGMFWKKSLSSKIFPPKEKETGTPLIVSNKT